MNKNIIKKFALLFVPIGTLVVITNFTIDPANLFATKKYVSGIAEIMARGHNVDGVSNFDERLLQKEVITRLKRTPEIIVMGSSRIMELGQSFFPGKTVLNCGVSRANIYDIVAIIGILDSLKRLPKKIIINLDPTFVCRNSPLEQQSIYSYYEFFNKKYLNGRFVQQQSFTLEHKKLLSLFSFEYFQKSLIFLRRGMKKQYSDIGLNHPLKNGRLSDGSISYEASYMHPDTLLVSNMAQQTASKTGLFTPDPERVKLLERLIPVLKARRIEITFLMLPYHESYFKTINDKQNGLFSSYEMLYKRIANEYNVRIIGSFNPEMNNIRNDEFYDVYHCSEQAIKKVFSRYQ